MPIDCSIFQPLSQRTAKMDISTKEVLCFSMPWISDKARPYWSPKSKRHTTLLSGHQGFGRLSSRVVHWAREDGWCKNDYFHRRLFTLPRTKYIENVANKEPPNCGQTSSSRNTH
jgi:hypothetical protein